MIKKSPYLILCLASVLLFGCTVKQNTEQFVEKAFSTKTELPLSGIQSSSSQPFPAFDSISINGPYTVEVVQNRNPYISSNGTGSVVVAGDSALVNATQSVVKNNTLTLHFNPEYKYNEDVRAKVTVYTSTPLQRVYYTGSGSIDIQNIYTDHFSAILHGSGYMFLAGAVNRLDATATGTSRLNAKCVIANAIFVNTTGLAQAEVLGGSGVSGLAAGESDIYYYSRPDMVAPYQRQSGSVMSMDGIMPADTSTSVMIDPNTVQTQDTDFGIK